MKHVRVHMFMLTTTGNFSSLPSAFSLHGAMKAEQLQWMPSTQHRVSPPDIFRQLLNQANCWLPGLFPLWQPTLGRVCSFSGFFLPTPLKRGFSSFSQSSLVSQYGELAENTSASRRHSHALSVLWSNFSGWDNALVGHLLLWI